MCYYDTIVENEMIMHLISGTIISFVAVCTGLPVTNCVIIKVKEKSLKFGIIISRDHRNVMQ